MLRLFLLEKMGDPLIDFLFFVVDVVQTVLAFPQYGLEEQLPSHRTHLRRTAHPHFLPF